jgi:hypothetical protein
MDGNATIITNSASGPVTTSIWVQSIQTETNTEFDDNQLKKGVSYRPIRRSEMSLDFTAIWSLKNFSKMDLFQETIRNHYKLIPGGNSSYMTFNYRPSNNKTELVYNGWIESVQKQFIRFQDVFVRNYRMNILMPLDNLEGSQSVNVNPNPQGLITPNNIQYYGSYGANAQNKWYNFMPVVKIDAKYPYPNGSIPINAITYNALVAKWNAQNANNNPLNGSNPNQVSVTVSSNPGSG